MIGVIDLNSKHHVASNPGCSGKLELQVDRCTASANLQYTAGWSCKDADHFQYVSLMCAGVVFFTNENLLGMPALCNSHFSVCHQKNALKC